MNTIYSISLLPYPYDPEQMEKHFLLCGRILLNILWIGKIYNGMLSHIFQSKRQVAVNKKKVVDNLVRDLYITDDINRDCLHNNEIIAVIHSTQNQLKTIFI